MAPGDYEGITSGRLFSLEEIKESRLGRFIAFGQPEECWPWKGSVMTRGYGAVSWKGKTVYVHRLIYSLMKGPIPKKHVVMHICSFAPCCNPAHLRVGTYRENTLHMWGRLKFNETEAQ